jgi:hypothetical protein
MHSNVHTNNALDTVSVWHRVRLAKVTGFGERLKLIVDELFDNQMEACIAFGISSPTLLRRYFTGMIVPSGSVLAAIAGCGINVNWLLTGSGDRCAHDESGESLKRYLQGKEPSEAPVKGSSQLSLGGALAR